MSFKVKGFEQEFETITEYKEAERLRKQTESALSLEEMEQKVISITATVIPASEETLEKTITSIEARISELSRKVDDVVNSPPSEEFPGLNKQGLSFGLTLRGESKGVSYTLEVIEGGYLCSNGSIYESLSGAALGVSGNRRSGWKFWKTIHGTEIGVITGRFKKDEHEPNPFTGAAYLS